MEKLKKLKETTKKKLEQLQWDHEAQKRELQSSIQKSVEQETTKKMNILLDKVEKSVSNQLLEANLNIIGTWKTSIYDSNKYEMNQEHSNNLEHATNLIEQITYLVHFFHEFPV